MRMVAVVAHERALPALRVVVLLLRKAVVDEQGDAFLEHARERAHETADRQRNLGAEALGSASARAASSSSPEARRHDQPRRRLRSPTPPSSTFPLCTRTTCTGMASRTSLPSTTPENAGGRRLSQATRSSRCGTRAASVSRLRSRRSAESSRIR